MAPVTRRQLAGAAAAAAVGAPAAALAREAEHSYDAQLVDLGRQLGDATAAVEAYLPTYHAACRGFRAFTKNRANYDAKATSPSSRPKRIRTSCTELERRNAIADALAEQILKLPPPATAAGLGVHVAAVAYAFSTDWDDVDGAEWPNDAAVRFAKTVQAFIAPAT
jgi:hypothetical protein